jgi:hypothetical protein
MYLVQSRSCSESHIYPYQFRDSSGSEVGACKTTDYTHTTSKVPAAFWRSYFDTSNARGHNINCIVLSSTFSTSAQTVFWLMLSNTLAYRPTRFYLEWFWLHALEKGHIRQNLPKTACYMPSLSFPLIIQGDQKCLCTWWLQYKNKQQYFKQLQSLTVIT